MENIKEILPIVIPLIVLEVVLTGASLIHILKHDTYKRGSRGIWIIVSFINIIGPVLYFTIGKGDE